MLRDNGLALLLLALPGGTPRAHARLLARQVLRETLGGLLSLPAEQVALFEGPYGPRLEGAASDIRVSLSYAGEWALIGLSTGRALGVDIVRIDSLPEVAALARDFLPAAACHAVLAAPLEERDACFAQAWAEMEACSKCLGLPLQEIGAEREQALKACALLSCEQVDGYRIAVAVRSPAGAGLPSS
ncbi:hypothetical protein SKTS_15540 [Sulfurimicrobium lacus]|uniref:4'-phosphopantetheinyl transferase domain-containing protein n=1 Tax=Sulfurimicrobium lacus TaxID=2715678 RepID=A0A6F8VAD0_9PROT|nr:4'-phosphopantetheinyl transferase superfamily protein [Sulfurimicrobium lacus]BCB26668.1 hypothetical protein SKTS_15540 [Sulfurimicrobium lacus]